MSEAVCCIVLANMRSSVLEEDIFLACANIKQISYAYRTSKMGCEPLIKTHGHKSLHFAYHLKAV